MVSMKGRGFEKRNAAGKNVPRLITFFHLHCILGKFTIAEKETDRLANLYTPATTHSISGLKS
jgi:hypothetical protein